MVDQNKNSSGSREDDYRDFEERNIGDGWPYADGSGEDATEPENRAYGETRANFENERNSGFRVDGTDENGAENSLKDSLRPDTIQREDSDELEARINEALEAVDDIDLDSIDIHADNGVITLEGAVETADMSRRVRLAVLGVSGVRDVRNRLELIGVDARIPD